jgi:hypothetical protein
MWRLRQEQLDAFGRANWEHFLRRAAAHLRSHFPNETAALSREALRERVGDLAQRARGSRLESEQGIMGFVHLHFLLGQEFVADARWQDVVGLLNDPFGEDPERALAALDLAVQQKSGAATGVEAG